MKATAFLFLSVLAFSAFAQELAGRVVGVTDGDTIKLLTPGNIEEKVRLAGIDAPEKAQPFGNVSKQHLSDQVFGKDVTVEWTKRDRYGRIVGKVEIDSRDACLEQVRAGLAWHYKKYQGEQSPEDQVAYAAAEDAARAGRVGLWSQSNPTQPWEWRRQK